MDKNTCKLILEKANFAFTHNKLILDKENKPISFKIIDNNEKFIEITQVESSLFLNKDIKESPLEKKDLYIKDFSIYFDVALKATSHYLEIYSENNKKWYKVQVIPTEYLCFAIFFFDITIYKEAEIKIFNKEQQFELAVSGSNDGIWDWDLENDNLYLSPRWKEQLGYEDYEIENNFSNFKSMIHEDDLEMVFTEVNKYLQGDIEKYDLEFRMLHKDKTYRWIRGRGEALRTSDNKVYRMAGSHTDITKQKEIEVKLLEEKENAEKATKAKSNFLASMSHEIRTPLNSIIGFSDLLKYTNLDKIQNGYVENINYSASTLLELINDILDFSKIEADKLELELLKENILKLTHNTIDIIRPATINKQLKFILNIQENTPAIALIDPLRLKQILLNLLTNALKFTEKGEIELNLSFEKINDKKAKYIFKIRDTGIGISKENQNKLFKIFSQVDDSTTRKFGGTGLGLAISNLLSEKMGSKIQVKSQLGIGSIFIFQVETEYFQEIDEEIKIPIKKELIDISNKVEKSILVVEDTPLNMKLIKAILSNIDKNIKVIEANNGKEALEKFQNNKLDLILMDIHMPIMDGLEASNLIRKYEKNIKNSKEVPIIALTAGVSNDEKDSCFKSGMNAFLSKPINKSQLIETLNILLYENERKDNFSNKNKKIEKKHFNKENLLNRIDNDMELFKELVIESEASLDSYIKTLIQLREKKEEDFENKMLHKIKGLASNMSFELLCDILQENNNSKLLIENLLNEFDFLRKEVFSKYK